MQKGKFSLFFTPSSGTNSLRLHVAAKSSSLVIQKKSFQSRHTPLNRPR